jgi:hypothetical protein
MKMLCRNRRRLSEKSAATCQNSCRLIGSVTECSWSSFGDAHAAEGRIRKARPEPSNKRCGYVVPNGTIDHSVFA